MEDNQNPTSNQVSGNSVFWALVALALNAMTGPSYIGYLGFNSGTADWPLDPLRLSPVFCGADIVMDIYFFIFPVKADDTTTNSLPGQDAVDGDSDTLTDPVLAGDHHPEVPTILPTGSFLKMVAFFLGVLPQAIKLFSMRGIVGTQISAAVLFAAPLIRTLTSRSPSNFAARPELMKNNCREMTIAWAWYLLLFIILTYLTHYMVYIWLYYRILTGLQNDTSDTVESLAEYGRIAVILYLLFVTFMALFSIRKGCASVTQLKPIGLSPALYFPRAGEEDDTGVRLPRVLLRLSSLAQAQFLGISVLICSRFIAVMFIASERILSRLLALRGHDRSLETSATSSGADGSATALSTLVLYLQQGMMFARRVFVGFCFNEWIPATWNEAFSMPAEQFITAYGIFHLATAILYYLVVFDSTGTWSPSWTSVLGSALPSSETMGTLLGSSRFSKVATR